LQYYIRKERRMNIIDGGGGRTTALFWTATQLLDLKKTSNALKPNTIHALDAALVRLTIYTNKYAIATIHDSFGAPLYDIEGIINLVNKNMNMIYYTAHEVEWYSNRQYYSIFAIF
jgi:DNA-directed RNA polymerase